MRYVYETYWRPAIQQLTAKPEVLELDRAPMPETDAVAVLCPIYKRTEHIRPLVESFIATTAPEEASILFLPEQDDDKAKQIVWDLQGEYGLGEGKPGYRIGVRSHDGSCAQKWNDGFGTTHEPWVLCIGDDVRFHEGWLDAARKLSGEFDVIGTNDTADKPKNPKVANGSHADHFFVRRAYVDEYGASLDGPGILAPECYRHWYVDMEIIKLAKARGVFAPCLDSVIEHLHPGYDGDEKARQADPTYMLAVEHGEQDQRTFVTERNPLIEAQRSNRARI
jgi:hypothetical protein